MTTTSDDRDFWAMFNEAEDQADAAIRALMGAGSDDPADRVG